MKLNKNQFKLYDLVDDLSKKVENVNTITVLECLVSNTSPRNTNEIVNLVEYEILKNKIVPSELSPVLRFYLYNNSSNDEFMSEYYQMLTDINEKAIFLSNLQPYRIIELFKLEYDGMKCIPCLKEWFSTMWCNSYYADGMKLIGNSFKFLKEHVPEYFENVKMPTIPSFEGLKIFPSVNEEPQIMYRELFVESLLLRLNGDKNKKITKKQILPIIEGIHIMKKFKMDTTEIENAIPKRFEKLLVDFNL